MTVRDFINFQNPKKVLSGNITFKILYQNSKDPKKFGKWYFYNEPYAPDAPKNVEEFCDYEGTIECMNLEIDWADIKIFPEEDEDGEQFIRYVIYIKY